MMRAGREVVRLYSQIGVTLRWEEHGPSDAVLRPREDEQLWLWVTILHDAPRSALGSEAAAPLSTGELRIANVYYGRVKRAASRNSSDPDVVLGHTIAHEVAHLIIPRYEHSSEGLMKAVWNAYDYGIAARGYLRFSDEQAALIRAALAP
jgi:hypothetical protein